MTATTIDLEALKVTIHNLGETVKELKAAAADKKELDDAVQALLTAKKEYAQNNNGMGVDGKPFQEPLSKAEKKAQAKAAKQQQQQQQQPAPKEEPADAEKKAAKKAANKAAKEAFKQNAAPAGSGKTVAPSTTTTPTVDPYHLVINPNVPLTERPVITLSVAVMLDVALDFTIVADPKCRLTCLGLPNQESVAGDLAMARAVLRLYATQSSRGLYHASQLAALDSWIDYAQSLQRLPEQQRMKAVILSVNKAVEHSTFVVGHSVSLADLVLFQVAGFPTQSSTMPVIPDLAVHAKRWFQTMAQHPALRQATQLCMGLAAKVEAEFGGVPMDPLVSGMAPLEGGVVGQVVTRFPPEPSGYLHIGHAKAVLLNDYFARRYKGRLIVRFDDTNPSKEKEEYQESIVEDLAKLGVKPHVVSYTSDYFPTIQQAAMELIQRGLAYMDDTPQEQMKAERAERQESKHRNQSVEDAIKYFTMMCSGSEEGSTWCLRAKIDMSSDNGTLRDPVIYRQNLEPHHRCGTKYFAYPTYDLACPIVDSLEGVSHALRTTEYNDRDEQYQWLQKALNLRRVRIHAFSRVNFKYTLLSKRKLTWFVENGVVNGWGDARMPTIRGVIRRGVNVQSLKNFIYSQGASRNVVLMDWMAFFSENKSELDKTAKRFMAVDKENNVKLTVTNGPSAEENVYVQAPNHPKDASLGTRAIRTCKQVILELVDVVGIEVGENIVLMRWGVVKVTKVDGNLLEGEYIPDGDYKTAKRKLTWMADVSGNTLATLTEFDHLVTKDKLDEQDDWKAFVNQNTMATTEVIGDAGLKTLQEHDVIQLERRGFYRVDRPYINDDKPMVLFMIPEGKKKSMSGMQGKLAHH